MRVTGMAFSVALLGGLAAQGLGSGGWKALVRGGDPSLALVFANGYRAAMTAGALLALLGAWASLARPRRDPGVTSSS